ncbi:MAG: hypothetical protein ACXW2Q_02405 [Thermoanaerobaculia bacterium]
MRNEMIGAVVRRVIEHPEFRKKLMENPHEALTSHGFALEDAELAEIEAIRSSVGSGGGDVERKLITVAERYGVHPRAEN